MDLSGQINLIASLATIISMFVALFAIVYQVRSFTETKVKISNELAEWETATDSLTGKIIEEIIIIKCVNEGFVPTAIESARFEIQFFDDNDNWNVMDIVGADRETQLAMPIKIDPAATARLRFVFNEQCSISARANKLIYI